MTSFQENMLSLRTVHLWWHMALITSQHLPEKLYKVAVLRGSIISSYSVQATWLPIVQPGLLIKYDPGKTGILASSDPHSEYLNLFTNFWSARHFSGGKDLLFSSDI